MKAGRAIRYWRAVCVAVILTGATAGKGDSEILKTWPSPDGKAKVVWDRIGPSDGDADQYALTLVRPGSKPLRLRTFGRSMDVTWSTSGKFIAFTDYIGSNVGDCYIVDIAKPASRVDMWDLIPNIPNLADADTFVICGDWITKDEVSVRVTGHIDTPGGGDFDYRYGYDVSKAILTSAPEGPHQ